MTKGPDDEKVMMEKGHDSEKGHDDENKGFDDEKRP